MTGHSRPGRLVQPYSTFLKNGLTRLCSLPVWVHTPITRPGPKSYMPK
ncbi:hypothetical protein F383_12539 [Gossypium arboreum]|uniref:Uncharacterized protein n=1 Tax=Gossypium arboreum TaxID=29729 RepID=A0A0B0N3V5_GOSAR|nr:hypothetical protein F383_12539 [Gossypium arboreum]